MAVKATRIPVQERSRQKREQILQAALDTFARTGFRGTDLGTVARRAGVSAPHVLYYFGSKEAIAEELVDHANAELHAGARAMYERGAVDGLPYLPDGGRLIEEHPTPAQLNAVLLAENLVEGALHGFFKERARDRRQRYAAMIRRSQAAGAIRADVDAEAEAADIFAFLEGLVYHHLLDPSEVSIEAGLRRYVTRLLQDIST